MTRMTVREITVHATPVTRDDFADEPTVEILDYDYEPQHDSTEWDNAHLNIGRYS